MKVSKRSLIVSIAVLCVCALSLTAASFAWFSTSTTASVNQIKLNVAKQSDLQISFTGAKGTFAYSLNFVPDLVAQKVGVTDVSTADVLNFYAPTMDSRKEAGKDGVIPADKAVFAAAPANGSYYKFDIYFRTTEDKSINMTAAAFQTADALIDPAMRVGVKPNATAGTIFANHKDAYNDVISSIDADGKATYTAAVNQPTGSAYTILKMSENSVTTDENDPNYKYAKATVYYWVEGTDAAATNDNAGYDIDTTLTFAIAE